MKNQAQATKEYLESMAAVDATLKRISTAKATMFAHDPNTVHWGHVGDMRRIELKLKELSDFIFNEGEYAN